MKNPASIGQAINLAAADARKHDRESDGKYIYERFVFWTHFCEMIQGSDLDMIEEVLNRPDVLEAMKNLKNVMEKK